MVRAFGIFLMLAAALMAWQDLSNAFGFGQGQPLAPNMVQWASTGSVVRTLTPVTDTSQLSSGSQPYMSEVILLQNLAGIAKGTVGVVGTAGGAPIFGTPPTVTPDANVAAALQAAGILVITSGPDSTGAIKQLWP